MSVARLSVDIQVAQEKRPQSFDKTPDGACLGSAGGLSPNLQPPTPPVFPCNREPYSASLVGGRYILLDQLEGSAMYRSVNVQTQEEFSCKVSFALRHAHISLFLSRPTFVFFFFFFSHPAPSFRP